MYVVIAYRCGNPTGYQFPVGVFDDLAGAVHAARSHHVQRGGKYDHKIANFAEVGVLDPAAGMAIVDLPWVDGGPAESLQDVISGRLERARASMIDACDRLKDKIGGGDVYAIGDAICAIAEVRESIPWLGEDGQ